MCLNNWSQGSLGKRYMERPLKIDSKSEDMCFSLEGSQRVSPEEIDFNRQVIEWLIL